MELSSKYLEYSVSDFICDEEFQNWVLLKVPEAEELWKSWLEANPEKSGVIDEARFFLTKIEFRVQKPDPAIVGAALNQTLSYIEMLEEQPKGKLVRLWKPVSMAAAVLILAVMLIWVYKGTDNYSETPQVVSTEFGQKDSLYLPDQSRVLINSNSAIRFNKFWQPDEPREVWLNGEALFHVEHLNKDSDITPGERFLVHVGPVTVEVLGTSFNIRQRREKIEVALINGSVLVRFNQYKARDIQLKPGQVLVIDTILKQTATSVNKAANPGAWTNNRLVLNNPTLKDITEYLEDIYGKKIQLAEASLANRKVEGPILLDSLDDALFVLSTVLNVSIIKDNDLIIIKPR